jgi:hypothetical protein
MSDLRARLEALKKGYFFKHPGYAWRLDCLLRWDNTRLMDVAHQEQQRATALGHIRLANDLKAAIDALYGSGGPEL